MCFSELCGNHSSLAQTAEFSQALPSFEALQGQGGSALTGNSLTLPLMQTIRVREPLVGCTIRSSKIVTLVSYAATGLYVKQQNLSGNENEAQAGLKAEMQHGIRLVLTEIRHQNQRLRSS